MRIRKPGWPLEGRLAFALAWVLVQFPLQAVPIEVASGAFDGHVYEVYYESAGITWTDAQAFAVANGGYLATFTSAAENSFAAGLVPLPSDSTYGGIWASTGGITYRGPWIGLVQSPSGAEPGGGWGWVTGEPFVYQNWASGEPNGSTADSDWGHLRQGSTSAPNYTTWNDRPNDNTVYGFIMEVPDPASTLVLLGLSIAAMVAPWRRVTYTECDRRSTRGDR